VPINVDYVEIGKESSDGLSPRERLLGPAYAEYRRMWVEHPQQHTVGDFPIHLDLEITSACDLRCVMCPRTIQIDDGTFREVKHMEWALFTKCVDEGVSHGLRSVKFNYLGEPLLHPRVVDMVRYCRDKGLVDVMFNTNATTLGEAKSRGLIEAGLTKIIFSVDSLEKERFERIRAKANFEQVMRNIKRFCEIREEMGSVTPITRASMTVMKKNRHELPAFIEYFGKIVDSVGYGELTQVEYGNNSEFLFDDIVRVVPQSFCCAQLWQRMVVWADGTVLPCCSDAKALMALGNAWTDSLYDLWRGPDVEAYRAIHMKGEYRRLQACRECSIPRLAASQRVQAPALPDSE
jgi:radical SAM protein with 4Fe4S-binding SPASM domain